MEGDDVFSLLLFGEVVGDANNWQPVEFEQWHEQMYSIVKCSQMLLMIVNVELDGEQKLPFVIDFVIGFVSVVIQY